MVTFVYIWIEREVLGPEVLGEETKSILVLHMHSQTHSQVWDNFCELKAH